MEKDLKAQNVASMTAIYVGTFLLLGLVEWGTSVTFALTAQLAEKEFVMATITSFGAVLSNFLPNSVKHPLVFLRFHNVLPGHRCKRICKKDPRFSMEDLEKRWPELFVQDRQESAQNAYWYKEIYSSARNDPEVIQAHRSFLLSRDAASGLFILLIGLSVWHVLSVHVSLPSLGPWSLLVLAGVILLLIQAGRQSGNRMVANAVAVRLMSEEEVKQK